MHPGRGKSEVFEKLPPLVNGERPPQMFPPLRGHMFFTQFAKSLYQKSAKPSCRCHILCGRAPELDRCRADLHRPGWSIRQEHCLSWHLFGQTKGVSGVGTGRLKAGTVAARQGLCHFFGGWLE